MITSGLVSVTFRTLEPKQIVPLATQAGFSAIEWGGDIHVPHGNLERAREVRKLTLDAGLKVASYGSYYAAGDSEAKGLSFASVLDTAVELGAPEIRIWVGGKGSADADAGYREQVTNDLRRIAEMAQARDVIISSEFHANTLHDSGPATLASLKAVNHPNLRTYWQAQHGARTETGLEEIKLLAPWITNIHVFQWWPDHAVRLPLAEGRARWQAFFQAIRTLPGDRYAFLEFVLNDSPEAFLADAATLKEIIRG